MLSVGFSLPAQGRFWSLARWYLYSSRVPFPLVMMRSACACAALLRRIMKRPAAASTATVPAPSATGRAGNRQMRPPDYRKPPQSARPPIRPPAPDPWPGCARVYTSSAVTESPDGELHIAGIGNNRTSASFRTGSPPSADRRRAGNTQLAWVCVFFSTHIS